MSEGKFFFFLKKSFKMKKREGRKEGKLCLLSHDGEMEYMV